MFPLFFLGASETAVSATQEEKTQKRILLIDNFAPNDLDTKNGIGKALHASLLLVSLLVHPDFHRSDNLLFILGEKYTKGNQFNPRISATFNNFSHLPSLFRQKRDKYFSFKGFLLILFHQDLRGLVGSMYFGVCLLDFQFLAAYCTLCSRLWNITSNHLLTNLHVNNL